MIKYSRRIKRYARIQSPRFELSVAKIMGAFVKRIRKSDGKYLIFRTRNRHEHTAILIIDILISVANDCHFSLVADCSFAVDRAYNSQAGGKWRESKSWDSDFWKPETDCSWKLLENNRAKKSVKRNVYYYLIYVIYKDWWDPIVIF